MNDQSNQRDNGLRYRWRRTWEDHPRDFVCETDDGELIGRIYFNVGSTSQPPHWQWFLNGEYKGFQLNSGGRVPARMDAARAIEDEYERVTARLDAMIERDAGEA